MADRDENRQTTDADPPIGEPLDASEGEPDITPLAADESRNDDGHDQGSDDGTKGHGYGYE